jgi:hypothetical protein
MIILPVSIAVTYLLVNACATFMSRTVNTLLKQTELSHDLKDELN